VNAVIHKAQVDHPFGVIPAKAGIQIPPEPFWIPDLRCASSGMTGIENTARAGHLVFPDKRDCEKHSRLRGNDIQGRWMTYYGTIETERRNPA
jgi:hypothetical protein